MAFVGVLMLDTGFPRPVGDIGHPASFAARGIPVRHVTVRGAQARAAVEHTDALQVQPFVDAALALTAQGARLIATSCGFLALHQAALQAAMPVPVISSALLWLVSPALAGESAGVLTFDAASLGPRHLEGVSAPTATPIAGLQPGCHLQRCILTDARELDTVQAERDVVDAARRLKANHPHLTTVVLECTNMPPYADAVAAATGCRVEHILSLIEHHWSPNP